MSRINVIDRGNTLFQLSKKLLVPLCVLLVLLISVSPVVADGVDLEPDYFDDDDEPVSPPTHEHDGIVFSEWTSKTSLPTNAGNYYLKYDVSIPSTWNVSSGETNLDLNGHSITFVGEEGSVISIGESVTLNLYDRVGTGKITGGKGVNSGSHCYGGGVYVWYGNFTMYGGNITGNTVSSGEYYNYGGGVYVYSGNFTMYGGNITGNTAGSHGGGVDVNSGGNFTMYGGNISGNTAHERGGGVYVWYGNFTMYGGNITGNEAVIGGGVYVESGGSFTMSGGNITDNTASEGGGVDVTNSGKFTMSGGNITGNTAYSGGGGVYVWYGNFTMYGGTITGNTAEWYGGGVYVSSGNFTMSGGNITGNTAGSHGGGVYVWGGGNFTMSCGNITGNTASGYGGGVYVSSGNFTMYGGTITGNTASNLGGGVYVNSDGSFTMSGGTITGNTAEWYGGGVYVWYGNFTMYGGNITGNTAGSHGGGVYVYSGNFTMSCGNITGNTASNLGGGGVYVSSGNFTMSGGTITGNTANSIGGGVYVYSGNFTMSGGNISSNTASSGGGGVYVGSSGTFTMHGGNISGNTASSGGGVYVGGNFTMSGSTIYSNTAKYYGGGIYFRGNAFNLSGGTVLDNIASGKTNNVYLSNDKYITVDPNGVLDNTNIGITTQNASTASTPIAITGVNTRDYSSYFFADNSSYRVENINNALYLVSNSSAPADEIFVGIIPGQHMTIENPATRNQSVNYGEPIAEIIVTADTGYYFDEVSHQENGLYYNLSHDKHVMFILGVPETDIIIRLADAIPEGVGPIDPTYHNVTLNITGHGTAFANPEVAVAGDLVTIKVIPDYGYELADICHYGFKYLNQTDNVTYWFEMPDNEVLIDVFFRNTAVEPIITIDVPERNISAKGTTTIPVTIHNAEDIISFSFEVFNDSLNADIAINKTYKPLNGPYNINNNNDPCILAWASTYGFSGNQTLFAIDVTPRDSISPDSPYINLSICVREMYTLDGVDVKPQYPMIFGTVRVGVGDIPTEFYGTITYDNGQPLPVGTVLTAEVNSSVYTYTLKEAGKIGEFGAFDDKLIIDDLKDGDTIIFSVAGVSETVPYVFHDVGDDLVYIELVFSLDRHTITVLSDGNGSASASWTEAAAGTVVNLTAYPYTGYSFVEWQVLSGNVSVVYNSFDMPEWDVVIKAVFAPNVYTVTWVNGMANHTYLETDFNVLHGSMPSYDGETPVLVTPEGKCACVFEGWNINETASFGFNVSELPPVESDIIYYTIFTILDHDLSYHDAKSPTCTEIGWNGYYTCNRDGCAYTTYEEIHATGHQNVTVLGHAPTCTASGLTDGIKCSVCNAILVPQTNIPALGHDFRYSLGTTNDTIVETCSRDGCTHHAQIAIHAPESLEEDGLEHNAEIVGNLTGVDASTLSVVYTRDGVSVTDTTVAGTYVASVTYAGVTASVQYTIAPAIYTITVTTETYDGETLIGNGGTASASATSATSGTEISLSAVPNIGYVFKEWKVTSGDITIQDNSFVMPAKNVGITVVFSFVGLTPIEDTRSTANAVIAAKVTYQLHPSLMNKVITPTFTRGGKTISLNETVLANKSVNGVEIPVQATIGADGILSIAQDVSDADYLTVTFLGRVIGDVTGDGKANTLDAARILQASAKIITLDTNATFYGDITKDGRMNTLDAARILQYSAHIVNENYEVA